MRKHRLLYAGLALIVVGVVGLALLDSGLLSSAVSGDSPEVRGEWIYRTVTTIDGRQIGHSGGMMMSMSCADCHGVDGRGLRTPMFLSPDITYRNLTDPGGMLEPDGKRGATFTDELIKRAITQGLDPEGEPLAWPMPRWRLTDAELNDLLAYLKTLS